MADLAGKPMVVAAFDFDHTLTTRDAVVPFIVATVGWRRLGLALISRPVEFVGALARRDRDSLRSLATTAFTGRTATEIASAGATFASTVIPATLRPDVVARLGAHRDAGHSVVIVSASYGDYLDPLAAELGCSAVLSTRLAVDRERCSGTLDGANCRGPEKVARLEAWLASQGLDRTDVEVVAYGDSSGDREMLAWADHAVWVDRDPLPALERH